MLVQSFVVVAGLLPLVELAGATFTGMPLRSRLVLLIATTSAWLSPDLTG
ncbi:MAG: hypothetical protein GY826_27000 [Fuerstiella sp.]|nr:hypothetical protein [Fuerstiella sp.]